MSRSLIPAFLALVLSAPGVAAQVALGDVELLGLVHGTRPPPSYYELMAREPEAFRFRSAWMRRNPALRDAGAPGDLPAFEPSRPALDLRAPAFALGRREAAVEGTFHFPLIIGLFSDSPTDPPFSREQVQREFFDGPNSNYKTVPEFYEEMSAGKVTLVGHTHGWVRAGLSRSQVTANQSALPGRIGDFILQLLTSVDDGSIDWGLFDNDGPDGIPNSGDDDGFVDILAVMHATQGAECDGSRDRVWSHKWNLQSATGQVYMTSTPSANGGYIRISDYTVQPVRACPIPGYNPEINQIGVFAHELGHAFGLPDLYCTASNCSHAGIGRWGLMGSGAWGCAPGINRPDRPCHMSAWSKVMLGWVDVETLPPGADLGTLTLGPVASARKVYRVDADDGSGNYFLLENRQRIGFDDLIPASGLLVWRIDDQQLGQRWPTNTVNNDRNRMGVVLLQADGRNDLGTPGTANRGDAGDPFPGATGNTVLHAGSTPSTLTHVASPSGLTLLDIALAGEDVRFRTLTRFQELTVRTVGGGSSLGGLLKVDGRPVSGSEAVVRAAPFQAVAIEAAPGAPLEEGLRRGFERWMDDSSLARSRVFLTTLEDAELVAEYGRLEARVLMDVEGERFGVSPGTVSADPFSEDFWFPEGTLVSFSASPSTGFGFREWTGALAGQANPASFQVDGPVEAGALFELTYGVPDEVSHSLEAAVPQEVVLVAENGSSPIVWTALDGRLPEGLVLQSTGVVAGAAMETGRFGLTVQARDASGLVASGSLTLDVTRPAVGVDALVGMFLLGTPAPTELQRIYLDRAGNRNGLYDLGDLRAFLRANPDLPMSAEQRALVRTLLPVVSFGPRDGPEGGAR